MLLLLVQVIKSGEVIIISILTTLKNLRGLVRLSHKYLGYHPDFFAFAIKFGEFAKKVEKIVEDGVKVPSEKATEYAKEAIDLAVESYSIIADTSNYGKELDIQKDVSFVGWTFDTKFANENKDLINAFLKASKESKEILKNSDEEWNRIKEQMSVKNDKEFEALKNGYKKGIIEEFDENSIGDLQKVFKILLKEGGEKFVEDSTSLDNSIFWNFDSK